MSASEWNGFFIGVLTFITTGGLGWIGRRVTKSWESIGDQLNEVKTKIDDVKRAHDGTAEQLSNLKRQVDTKDGKIEILWAERMARRND